MRKKLLWTGKFLGKTLLFFLLFIGLYLLTAYLLSSIKVEREADNGQEVTIYILTNGVHTDIVVPAKNEQINWTETVRYNHTTGNDSSASWLAMGWGDKGFYLQTPTWAELKPSVAFRAAFGLGSSAIHTTYYKQLKESEICRKIRISKQQYQRLVNYIKASFQTDSGGQVQHIITTANYGTTDAFYEAKGSYSLFKTCNTWANNVLKAAGQKACYWTAFDTGIFSKYE
ncbi:TIGR02117 family protein [Flavihumibacter sp. CACIAM 22H1]|uniref:TIGR02117 family protein n=1 Tax=Flavihumibacter sp. CACIAM 22H1 TaxID=1812911 RepID=UPI0007A89C55|nr:TIGR02117 family protein [Flavihumibacter sp. CACIAM 22H1]KYP14465.1 MAG: urease-associated protein [Flavihumibacter sp. CACIAM 22H1]